MNICHGGAKTYLNPDERGSIQLIATSTTSFTVNTYDEYGLPAAGNTESVVYEKMEAGATQFFMENGKMHSLLASQ